MKLPWYKWIEGVEATVSGAVTSCVLRDWDEDFITRTWLRRLTGTYRRVEIEGISKPFQFEWDAYKLTGKAEKARGDVAVLVRVQFEQGDPLEGVAFLEAKRIYRTSYEAIEWPQLRLHSCKAANHRLLLYDKQPLDWKANLHYDGNFAWPYPWPWLFKDVQAFCLPSPHALAYGSKSRGLNNLSQPLSWQLCCRYIRGFDLDYAVDIVESVKQGVPDVVNYLLVVSVSFNPERPPSNEAVEINPEELELLEPDEDS